MTFIELVKVEILVILPIMQFQIVGFICLCGLNEILELLILSDAKKFFLGLLLLIQNQILVN